MSIECDFSDFSSLRDSISQEQDKIIFDEIIRCIKSEALRAAFIMTWISIAESLYNKINVMSMRDTTIKRSKDIIDGSNPKDSELLVQSEIIGLISDKELFKLESIRKTRNSYAHPTMEAPTLKEVLCALNSAVSIVLARPPLLRFSYATDFIQSLLTDFHYFEDDEELINKYAEDFIYKLHPDVYKNAFSTLLNGTESIFFESNYQMRKIRDRGFIFGTKLLLELISNDMIIDKEVFLNKCLDDNKFSTSNIYTEECIWNFLTSRVQNRTFGYLLENESEGDFSKAYSIKRIYNLYSGRKLNDDFNERFESFINEIEYETLLECNLPIKVNFNRLINDLQSYNYYTQNETVEFIKISGLKEIEKLDNHSLEILGRNILQAAEGGSNQSMWYIDHIGNRARNGIFWPKSFVEGLLLETLVNEKKEFRFKSKRYITTLRISTNHPQSDIILDRLLSEVSKSNPKHSRYVEDYEKAIDKMYNNVFSKKLFEECPKINELIELLKAFNEEYGK